MTRSALTRAHVTDRPLADHGLQSYRYAGPYGHIMIGARDTDDALQQAALSTFRPVIERLQVWDGKAYVPVQVAA